MIIPVIDAFNADDIEKIQQRQPDFAWKLMQDRMSGAVDGLEAVKQAARKRLDTEAGAYDIYSASYGLKTLDLIGKEIAYGISQLQQRIKGTLQRDDRISGVTKFSQQQRERRVKLSFTVSSVYGEFELEKEVQL